MQEYIRDVIAWGRVVVQGKEFFLLAPKPYHSEMGNGVGHSVWQPEGTLKWEVADSERFASVASPEDRNRSVIVYFRSLIIFGSDALIEFFQDPKTIKVSFIVPQDDDDDNVAVAPTN